MNHMYTTADHLSKNQLYSDIYTRLNWKSRGKVGVRVRVRVEGARPFESERDRVVNAFDLCAKGPGFGSLSGTGFGN